MSLLQSSFCFVVVVVCFSFVVGGGGFGLVWVFYFVLGLVLLGFFLQKKEPVTSFFFSVR